MMKGSKHWCVVVALAWLMAPLPMAAGTPEWRGDANKDGKLSVADLTAMIRLLGQGKPAEALADNPALDANKDGIFSIKDVNTLTMVLLGKDAPQRMTAANGCDDSQQSNPTMGGAGGMRDEEQDNPSTGSHGGGLKDSDMGNPE